MRMRVSPSPNWMAASRTRRGAHSTATAWAARDGVGEGVAAVVVESTFTSIPALVKGLRWGWVPGLDYAITQRFDSLSKVSRVDKPLLILHGTADRLVPESMADE